MRHLKTLTIFICESYRLSATLGANNSAYLYARPFYLKLDNRRSLGTGKGYGTLGYASAHVEDNGVDLDRAPRSFLMYFSPHELLQVTALD
ncbi:hypothetical protein LIER_30787 [Lithospermum erythrorhizon]|uniref:Uncharacterized protein n=1 Tax=Lithospermum erythrorhizon TaxID=34254 RepID=A0AAV3RSJ1_LITER